MNLPVVPQSEVQERQRKALAMIEINGGLPAIAPTWMLEHPIWHEHGFASHHANYRRVYFEPPARYRPFASRVVVETSNDLPITPSRSHSGGLLRYLDMDLAIAMSRAWTLRGTPYFECFQTELLAWMGITKDAPYRGLKGSFDRLKRTAIAMYIEGTPLESISWFTVLERIEHARDHFSRGQPRTLQVSLSRDWTQALESLTDWTVLDLEIYAHLVRTQRRHGFARMLYLFLATRRSRELRFRIGYSELRDRFADRLPGGRPRFRDALHPRSRLRQAMEILFRSGAIDWDGSSGDIVAGRFLRPVECRPLPRYNLPDLVPESGGQMGLPFNPGIFGEPPPPAITGPPAAPPLQPLKLAARALMVLAPGLREQHLRDALAAGWIDTELGHLLGYVLAIRDSLRDPTGFIRNELRQGGSDTHYRQRRWSQAGVTSSLPEWDYANWKSMTTQKARDLVAQAAKESSS